MFLVTEDVFGLSSAIFIVREEIKARKENPFLIISFTDEGLDL